MARVECECGEFIKTTLLDHLEKQHPEIFDKFNKREHKNKDTSPRVANILNR